MIMEGTDFLDPLIVQYFPSSDLTAVVLHRFEYTPIRKTNGKAFTSSQSSPDTSDVTARKCL